jgi:acyl carrier protein phosphodiesterase
VNYLAHAYLSFDHPQILVGNLISDFVKGKKRMDYPPDIQKGISLHRFIDTFTDSHPATKEAKQVFQSAYRLYSGAFVDVVYDHFLATDEQEFSESALHGFASRVYDTIEQNIAIVPDNFARMFVFMKRQNWLFEYRTIPGIEKGFNGVVRRAAYIHESETASRLFETHYQLLKDCYRQFWKDVKPFAIDQFHLLLHSTTTDPS